MVDVVFVTRRVDYLLFRTAYASLQIGLKGARRPIVVVPDRELELYRGLGVDAVPESRLDRRLAVAKVHPWLKQQILKLCLHRVMQSDVALVLDSDVLLCRKTAASSFSMKGRAPFYVEDPNGRAHTDWHGCSAEFLGLPPRHPVSYFPTPNFLHRTVLSRLHEHIAKRWCRDSVAVLMAHTREYTEWAAYGLFLQTLPDRDEFQVLRLADHVAGIWEAEDLERWDPGAQVKHGPPFAVVQSSLRLPWMTLKSRLDRNVLLRRASTFSKPYAAWLVPKGTPMTTLAPGARRRGKSGTPSIADKDKLFFGDSHPTEVDDTFVLFHLAKERRRVVVRRDAIIRA